VILGRYQLVAVAVLVALVIPVAAVEPPGLIQMTDLTKNQFLTMAQLGLDIVETRRDTFRIFADSREMIKLAELGLPFEVIHPDVVDYYRSKNKQNFAMGGFRSFGEVEGYLDSLVAAHPTLMTPKFSIGTSLQGRPLWCVKVSDNPGIDEDEPELLYISLIHAREPAGGAALLNVLEHFVTNYGSDPEIAALVDNRELYFLPVQNPDGLVLNEDIAPFGGGWWRKNMRNNGDGTWGVDLNRNYGFKWGYDNFGSSGDPSSETYRGSGPFSEPETQAVRDFVASRNFVIIHNFHTYSNLELWPWGYDRYYTDREEFYSILGDSMCQYNGYAPSVGWGLYPTNGDADDWAWGDTLTKPRTISPPRAPVISGPGITAGEYTIAWEHDDSSNPATDFHLYEMTDRSQVVDNASHDEGYWDLQLMSRAAMRFHSSSYSWHDKGMEQTNHWIESTVPYEVTENDSLRFWLWYNIEDGYDYFYAQLSVDGGKTFVNLPGNLTTNENVHLQNLGNGITGASAAWVRAVFDLSAWEGSFVTFRLAYYTDPYLNEEGVYIDDIENIDFYASVDTISLAPADTSYDFADRPVGDYWYRVEAEDIDGQISALSSIAWAGVIDDFIVGDCDRSGGINVADLTYLVATVFQGGRLPIPEVAGDVDCSGTLNVADITLLVAVLFQGGATPSCP